MEETKHYLFRPFKLRGIELRNRIAVAPMCQYSATDGIANNWHLVHLGSRAVGGAGLVITEATAVSADARITPGCLGLWSDAHVAALKPVTAFIADHGAVAGVQLNHAGRKASRPRPWDRGGPLASGVAWPISAPSALPFNKGYAVPSELSGAEIEAIVEQFAAAALRALEAGFKLIELHMAHGYLLHSFLSPLTNKRHDEFGGDFRGRVEFPLRVAKAVRSVWPEDLPLLVRLSVTDWLPGGLTLEDSIEFAKLLKAVGIDMIDCSSGFGVPDEKIPSGYPFQVPFSSAIRKQAGIATGAVGFILDPQDADDILAKQDADLVFIARGMLNDPYWPKHAASTLGDDPHWPVQYAYAVRHFHDKAWQANALGRGQTKSVS